MKLGNMFKKTNQKNYITLTNRKANVQETVDYTSNYISKKPQLCHFNLFRLLV